MIEHTGATSDSGVRTETRATIKRILRPKYSGYASTTIYNIYDGSRYIVTRVSLKANRAEVRLIHRKPGGVRELISCTGSEVVFTMDMVPGNNLSDVMRRVCKKTGLRLNYSLGHIDECIQAIELSRWLKLPPST
jgi:hypothetical protein